MDAQNHILVVDDTAMFRELESVFLSRFGTIVTAHCAEAALTSARRQRPAVIVTDLHMPGMDGDTLCRHIRADRELRDIPVIVVISGENARDRARAVRAGADDIVAKPISRMSLVEAVSRFLRAQRQPALARVDLQTSVHIRSRSSEAWGRCLNLSRGGLFVAADRLLPVESEVELQFLLPEAREPLSSTARVVWGRDPSPSGPAGMGLQFLALDNASSRQIESFVHERSHPAALPGAASGSSAA